MFQALHVQPVQSRWNGVKLRRIQSLLCRVDWKPRCNFRFCQPVRCHDVSRTLFSNASFCEIYGIVVSKKCLTLIAFQRKLWKAFQCNHALRKCFFADGNFSTPSGFLKFKRLPTFCWIVFMQHLNNTFAEDANCCTPIVFWSYSLALFFATSCVCPGQRQSVLRSMEVKCDSQSFGFTFVLLVWLAPTSRQCFSNVRKSLLSPLMTHRELYWHLISNNSPASASTLARVWTALLKCCWKLIPDTSHRFTCLAWTYVLHCSAFRIFDNNSIGLARISV